MRRSLAVDNPLIVGAAFCLAAACASNVPGTLANLALAAMQAFLAFTR
jgi:hypothetical protein